MISEIRKKEMEYHKKFYSENTLFESGSWLHKPVQTVLDSFMLVKKQNDLMILDIGAGVGRNAIPIAKKIKGTNGKLVCVDILDDAIEILNQYSKQYDVEEQIVGIKSSFDDYEFRDKFDFIYAVSVLEHLENKNVFIENIKEMVKHTNTEGINCLILNTSVTEYDKDTGEELVPQFEIDFKSKPLIKTLRELYREWSVIKSSIKDYAFDITRQDRHVKLKTSVVTFVVRKQDEIETSQ